MELKAILPRSVLIFVISLLSEVTWRTMAYDIKIEDLQISLATSKTHFTSTSWTTECGNLGLVPTRNYLELTDVIPLTSAVQSSAVANTPVWAGQAVDDHGTTYCKMAFLNPDTSAYSVGVKKCLDEAHHLCKAPTPEIRLLSASEADAGQKSFLCYVEPSSFSKIFFWYKTVSSGTSYTASGDPQYAYGAAVASTVGDYWCLVKISDTLSEPTPKHHLLRSIPRPTLLLAKGYLGQTARLLCVTGYNKDVTREFTWYRQVASTSVELTGYPVSENMLNITNMSLELVGTYFCTETIGDLTSVKSVFKDLSFLVPTPTIVAQHDYDNVIIGDTVTLVCNTGFQNDSYERSYRWYRNSQELTQHLRYNGGDIAQSDGRTSSAGFQWTETGSNHTVSIDDFSEADALRYSCAEIIENVISTLSEQLVLNYTEVTPSFQANTTEGLFGSSVELVCDIGMEPPPTVSFVWYYTNNSDTFEVTRHDVTDGNEMVIASYNPIHVGFYSCAVANQEHMLSSKSSWVELVFQVPQPRLEAASETVTLGETLRLICHDAFDNSNFASDPFTYGYGMDIDRRYRWFWISGTVISELEQTTSNTHTSDNFRHARIGKYSCVQVMGTEESSHSSWVTIDFHVPKPVLAWADEQTTIDIDSRTSLRCNSSYLEEPDLAREYITFSKIARDAPPVVMNNRTSSVFPEVQVLPFFACSESIEDVQSARSEWLELNIFVKTPTVLEIWDEETDQVEITCQHGYQNFELINEASFTWYDNTVPISTGAGVSSLVPSGNTMIGYGIGQDRSGDFSCSMAFIGISSNISTEVTSEDKVNKPSIVSSSKETVPSGSHVRLRCQWKSSYSKKFLWRHNGNNLARTDDNLRRIRKFTEADNGDYTCAIRNDDNEWKESDPIHLETVDPFAVCYCPCDNTTKDANVTQEKVQELVTSLKGNLTVEKSALSATIREKTSAPDERVTSVSAGAAAISLITVCVLLIVIPDAITAGIWVVTKIKYITSSSASVDLVH